MEIVRSHPLAGVGTGGFAAAYARQVEGTGLVPTVNPHNEYLNIAVQLGMAGLLALGWLFFLVWRHAAMLPTRLERDLARGLAIAFVVGSLFNSLLMDHVEGLFFAWCAGVLFGGYASSRQQPGSAAAMSLSVIVITKNEAAVIERCLSSVAWADEIIVFDTDSSDGTADIARRLGARVETAPDWPGFGPQKNRALALATGDWVLSLDADEWVTPELRAEIERAIAAPDDHAAPTACRGCRVTAAASCAIRAGGRTMSRACFGAARRVSPTTWCTSG